MNVNRVWKKIEFCRIDSILEVDWLLLSPSGIGGFHRL